MIIDSGAMEIKLPFLMNTLSTKSSPVGFGKLGVNWTLATQIAGWVIQGIGLGMSVHDAVTHGAEKAGAGAGTLDEAEVNSLAASLAAADPQKRSPETWAASLSALLGPASTLPVPVACPAGSYRDVNGICMPVKAGFFDSMSTGGWVALGVGGLVVAKMLKVI